MTAIESGTRGKHAEQVVDAASPLARTIGSLSTALKQHDDITRPLQSPESWRKLGYQGKLGWLRGKLAPLLLGSDPSAHVDDSELVVLHAASDIVWSATEVMQEADAERDETVVGVRVRSYYQEEIRVDSRRRPQQVTLIEETTIAAMDGGLLIELAEQRPYHARKKGDLFYINSSGQVYAQEAGTLNYRQLDETDEALADVWEKVQSASRDMLSAHDGHLDVKYELLTAKDVQMIHPVYQNLAKMLHVLR